MVDNNQQKLTTIIIDNDDLSQENKICCKTYT